MSRLQTPIDIDLLNITIANWTKFNPRSDRTSWTWFRLDNTYFEDQSVFALSTDQKLIYLFILCQASKKGKDALSLRISYVSAMLKLDAHVVAQAFKIIAEVGLITLSNLKGAACHQAVSAGHQAVEDRHQEVSERRPTDKTDSTDKTDITNSTDTESFDFELLYKKYPLKKGKEEGLQRCRALITTQELYDQISIAIDHYSADLIRNRTEAKFIKHFSTFLENRKTKPYVQPWRDWISPEAGTCSLSLVPAIGNGLAPLTKAQQISNHNNTVLAEYAAKHGIKGFSGGSNGN